MKKMCNRLCLLITYTFFLTQSVYAEYFKHIGISDGLSQLSVMSIHQDILGRMWFGTKEGLNVYNGDEIISYKAYIDNHSEEAEKVLIGNDIYTIQSNQKGDVFIIANNSLLKYDIRKEIFKKVTNQNTYALASYDGGIWCVVNDSVFVYDDKTEELRYVIKTEVEGITWLTVTEDKFYLGSKTGLYEINRENYVIKNLLPGIEIYRVFESSLKEIWVGCRMDGLYRINREGNITRVPYLPGSVQGVSNNQIRDFVEDRSQNIWFGTFQGLQKYDSHTGEYSLISVRGNMGGLEHSSVFSLCRDHQGTIWVGTYYGGVNYFNPDHDVFSRFIYRHDQGNKLYSSYIGDIVEDNDGDIWFGSDGGGLSYLNRKTYSFTNIVAGENSLPHNNIKTICYDSKRDQLYIGTYLGGLSRYDRKKKTFYNYLKRPKTSIEPGNYIYQVKYWQDRLYISSQNGIFVLDPDKDSFKLIRSEHYCYNFDIDADGFLWLILGRTLTRLNPVSLKAENIINLENHGCDFAVSNIMATNSGIYITTLGNGIYYYDKTTEEVINFTSGDGRLLSNYCYNMAETSLGSILITSDKGITFYSPVSRGFRSIGLSLGFPAPAIVNGCGIFISPSNEIYIGDVDGITSFRESDLKILNEEKKLYLSKLAVNNKEIYPDDGSGILDEGLPFINELILKYKQNDVIFNFALSNYMDLLHDGLYEYKLEGFNKDWIPTRENALHYTNLNSGKYILRVRTKSNNPNVIRRDKEIALTIIILTPWYNTWWAWLIYISIIASLVFYYLRSRSIKRKLAISLEKERFEKQKNEQVNQAKLLFFTNVSHEFRTPLTLIISHIELLLQNMSIPPALYSHIVKINKHALQMRSLVSELLDFRKFEQNHVVLKVTRQDIVSFLREIYLSYLDYSQQRQITYLFNSEITQAKFWFDIKQMEKVFFNLLSNAFKYTPDGGNIEVNVSLEQGDICVKIIDNGTGIEYVEMERIFERFYQAGNEEKTSDMMPGTGIGLALTKSIVDKHQGTITVESEIGKGSTFIVRLRDGKEHYHLTQGVEFPDSVEQALIIPDSFPGDTAKEDIEIFTETSEIIQETRELIYTLLIVEDNEDLLKVLKQLFSPFYHILLARDGKEGLETAMDKKPDIIISDVMMPKMTGIEMCLQIKNSIDLCHIPIILLTALNTTEQNVEGLSRGADDYVVKPFNARILLARCNNLLRNRLLIQQQFTQKPMSKIDLTAINPLDKNLLTRTIEIIDKYIDNPNFDIPALCQELGIGRTLLYSKFKVLTGMTPNTFILNHRLKCAAMMLRKHPEMRVTEISDSLGFGSSVYFSRCFKSHFNMTPQAYRNHSDA